MTTFTRESSLLAPVSGYLRRKGFSRQREELQFFEHSIDLYGLCPRREATTAIELKLFRWRRALQQALIYQLCADYVYIALPRDSVSAVDRESLTEHGVGLISVSPRLRCRIVLEAQTSPHVLSSYREFYHTILKERGTE